MDAAYLFGSQVNNKVTKLSDVDLAVLFKKGISDSKCFDLRLQIIGDVCRILKTERVDVVDLKKAPLKFRYQAFFPKFTIVVKNKPRMVELEQTTVKRFLDIQPYLHLIAQRQLRLTAEKGFSK